MSDNNIAYETFCAERSASIRESIKSLELRVFDILKSSDQVAEMASRGHKEALASVMGNMTKGFLEEELKFKEIDAEIAEIRAMLEKHLEKLSAEDSELKKVIEAHNVQLQLNEEKLNQQKQSLAEYKLAHETTFAEYKLTHEATFAEYKTKTDARFKLALKVIGVIALVAFIAALNKDDLPKAYEYIIKLFFKI